MNGMPFFQALLFGVAALAALGLLVGYRTRLMTIVVWVLLLSLHMRNPLVNGAESPMLRMLLFWGMLLPLGAYWSVDRAKRPRSRGCRRASCRRPPLACSCRSPSLLVHRHPEVGP
jgi:hypothetical protein